MRRSWRGVNVDGVVGARGLRPIKSSAKESVARALSAFSAVDFWNDFSRAPSGAYVRSFFFSRRRTLAASAAAAAAAAARASSAARAVADTATPLFPCTRLGDGEVELMLNWCRRRRPRAGAAVFVVAFLGIA